MLGYDLAEPHEPLLVGGAVVADVIGHVVLHVGRRCREEAGVVAGRPLRRGRLHGGCRQKGEQHPRHLVHGWTVDWVPLGAQQGELEGLPD